MKKRERTVSPSDSFDSEDDSPRATSPLLQPVKSAKPEIRKSSSIGKLQGVTSEKRRGKYNKSDLSVPTEQASMKIVLTE